MFLTQCNNTIKMYLIILLLFYEVCSNVFAKSSNFLDLNPKYKPYMQYAVLQNYMVDNELLKQLKHKLKKHKDLRIRVFGDSHVANDFITNELRSILGHINSVGFAYPLMPSYHQSLILSYENNGFLILDSRKPSDYVDYPMGGIVAYPESLPASINLSINSKIVHSWSNKFITKIVFKNSDTLEALQIEDSQSNSYTLNASKANEWETVSLQLHFPITIHALNKDVKLGGYFIYKEKNNNIVEHLGVNGVRSDIWKKWNKETLEKELKELEYDIIMLCYGSNDAVYNTINSEKFIEKYREFILMLKESNPNAIIILISPPPVLLPINASKGKYQISKTFLPIKEAIEKIAKIEQIMLFDIDDFIEKNGSKNSWVTLNLSKKDVHLTPQGYKIIAHGIYQALIKILK